jgi:hypothetical protein
MRPTIENAAHLSEFTVRSSVKLYRIFGCWPYQQKLFLWIFGSGFHTGEVVDRHNFQLSTPNILVFCLQRSSASCLLFSKESTYIEECQQRIAIIKYHPFH